MTLKWCANSNVHKSLQFLYCVYVCLSKARVFSPLNSSSLSLPTSRETHLMIFFVAAINQTQTPDLILMSVFWSFKVDKIIKFSIFTQKTFRYVTSWIHGSSGFLDPLDYWISWISWISCQSLNLKISWISWILQIP